MCNLHFADDLIIVSAGGLEDLRIVKLILLLFEGLSGLAVNFDKSCLYSSKFGASPDPAASGTLNCASALLPLTYLGIPISGRRPTKGVWSKLIEKIGQRLLTWKHRFLSLGGRLVLINSVLSAIPSYWMSVFRLPSWVIRAIDNLRRDFLWSGPILSHCKSRLVSWSRICKSKDQGGWGVINLEEFNLALLAKWWWKLNSIDSWCWSQVIKFNYSCSGSGWNPLQQFPSRKSFFWAGLLSCLSVFCMGTKLTINNGRSALFWHDRWLEGGAPKDRWPDLFLASNHRGISIRDACSSPSLIGSLSQFLPIISSEDSDSFSWVLDSKGIFSVKSLYRFINDGGLRSGAEKTLWCSYCPRKVNAFAWLLMENRILTLDILFKRKCNKLPTSTCVMCHGAEESANHLMLHCEFADRIWSHFGSLFGGSSAPANVVDVWSSWREALPSIWRLPWCLLAKAIFWNIWLERNSRIFDFSVHSPDVIIRKINYTYLAWFSAVPVQKKRKLEVSAQSIRRSICLSDISAPQDVAPTVHDPGDDMT